MNEIVTFREALVGAARDPDAQNILRLMDQHGIKSIRLVPCPTNPADPNAIQVLAIFPDLSEHNIGWVPNRARCDACDPKRKAFGFADYEVGDRCPNCGGETERGVATQMLAMLATNPLGLEIAAEIDHIYQSKSTRNPGAYGAVLLLTVRYKMAVMQVQQ